MKYFYYIGCVFVLLFLIGTVQSTCVLESDFGFKINCAFKKSGLFRVRNLGGVKAHASIGFSLGDELGFEQSLTNLDPSRRRSVSIRNGVPVNTLVDTPTRNGKQEKRGKQNRIMMRPMAPASRPNQAAMDKLSTLHRRVSSTMQPIIVGPTIEIPKTLTPVNVPMINSNPSITQAKPMGMGVPPFRPLPPKDETLKVLPLASTTKKIYTPLQIPQSKGPGLAYQNPAPNQIHDLANQYAFNTKKVDDYNSITGYNDDTVFKINKDDINAKIVEIAKAGNISMEAVEAAIALRQQQLLTKYANIGIPSSSSSSTTTTTTTTTSEPPSFFQPEPEPEIVVVPAPSKPKNRNPTTGKVMNAPREYYPVGYEKNFDDHFQSKVDLPDTNFHCGDQKYFPGLYGDETLGCMVFHVCALTDDGLVMKSFLCPESTLFDQTIMKCNWWFYVDCKNTRKLYDTNIPVSKSYQLMKALTFFSSYKKEMQDSATANPEEDAGIKEAITILQNQDNQQSQSYNQPDAIQIITPHPFIDERTNHKEENISSPVYRGTRDFNVTKLIARRPTFKPKIQEPKSNSDIKLITLNANFNFKNNSASSDENTSKTVSETSTEKRERTTEKRHRRRMTLKNHSEPTTTTVKYTTTTEITTQKPVFTTFTSLRDLIRQEIQPMDNIQVNRTEEKQEKLTDEITDLHEIDHSILKDSEKLPTNKRFYRSSAEANHDNEEKEVVYVNNEKVQVIRPTSSARLVGEYQTPTATIARLDEAVLGSLNKQRFKKSISSRTVANQNSQSLELERT